eukprot:c6867_g1_i1.p1 GENE.c6867_g1_i1~~c6867_g1_i1.p1  ORF type:complete len:223 (-),score=56.42 c6867_g1_i1:305-946(-)
MTENVVGEWMGKLGLERDVMVPFIMTTLNDSTADVNERVAEVAELVSGYLETEHDLSEFCEQLKVSLTSEQKVEQVVDAGELLRKAMAVTSQEDAISRSKQVFEKSEMTLEELKKKQDIVRRYGYEEDMEEDEEGNYVTTKNRNFDRDDSSNIAVNDNSARVTQALQAQRERDKHAHALQVQRDKEAAEKQAQAKLAKKERTQKQERKGRGMM